MRRATGPSGMTSLFEDDSLNPVKTEGVKYAGSKLRLIPQILELARRVEARSVFDGFTGTTRVAQAFAQTGYRVVASDISAYSKVFGECYLLSKKTPKYYADLVAHLNSVPEEAGWFTEHYGGPGEDQSFTDLSTAKRPWQNHNTRKLDAIRAEIDRLRLDSVDRSVLLTSLILALDEVDSTLGHFASYLKSWSPRSFRRMRLRVPNIQSYEQAHEVYQGDIFAVAPTVHADIAYLDPPYGSNNEKMPPSRVRYQAYYHLWTTVCLNDTPEIFGKANRRSDTSDTISASVFEEFRRGADGAFIAVQALERLLSTVNSPHIILSYSSGGRATRDAIAGIIGRCGKLLETVLIDHRPHVMGQMKWTDAWTSDGEDNLREFLFLIQK